jgi:CBS-domain-containing membrane protein
MDLLKWLIDYRDAFVPVSMTKVFSTPITQLASVRPLTLTPTAINTTQKQPQPHHLLLKPSIITVPETSSALTAFRALFTHQISAVPITDSSQRVIANLSASDFRGLQLPNLDSLSNLLLPVYEFLETKVVRTPLQLKADQLRFVKMEELFEKAVRCCVDEGIHRVWVEDEEERCVGVLTLTDMLGVFVPDNEKKRKSEDGEEEEAEQ